MTNTWYDVYIYIYIYILNFYSLLYLFILYYDVQHSSLSSAENAIKMELIASRNPEYNFIDTVQSVLRTIEEFFDVERVGFLIINRQCTPPRLELLVSQNDSGTSLPMAGIAGACASSGTYISVPNCYKDPRFDPSMDIQTGLKTRTLLAMPIFLNNQSDLTSGVLQLINPR
jgi:hypothetical protein